MVLLTSIFAIFSQLWGHASSKCRNDPHDLHVSIWPFCPVGFIFFLIPVWFMLDLVCWLAPAPVCPLQEQPWLDSPSAPPKVGCPFFLGLIYLAWKFSLSTPMKALSCSILEPLLNILSPFTIFSDLFTSSYTVARFLKFTPVNIINLSFLMTLAFSTNWKAKISEGNVTPFSSIFLYLVSNAEIYSCTDILCFLWNLLKSSNLSKLSVRSSFPKFWSRNSKRVDSPSSLFKSATEISLNSFSRTGNSSV